MRRADGRDRPRLLWAIIVLKIVKGVLFLSSAVALVLFRQDPSTRLLRRVAAWVDDAPRLHLTARLLRDLSMSFEMHFSVIVAACVMASGALLAEGVCLAAGYTWAPWFAIALTGFWIPLEVIELVHRFRVRTLAVTIINAAIVCYLFRHRGDFRRHTAEDQIEI